MSLTGKSIGRKQIGGCQEQGQGGWGVTANGDKFSFWGDENVPEVVRGGGYIIL